MSHKRPDHIDKQQEWQDHQFEPGYFTGGKIPVWLHEPGKPKRLGAILLIAGFFYLSVTIYYIFTLVQNINTESVISIIFSGIISITLILAGIAQFHRK